MARTQSIINSIHCGFSTVSGWTTTRSRKIFRESLRKIVNSPIVFSSVTNRHFYRILRKNPETPWALGDFNFWYKRGQCSKLALKKLWLNWVWLEEREEKKRRNTHKMDQCVVSASVFWLNSVHVSDITKKNRNETRELICTTRKQNKQQQHWIVCV